MSIHWLQKKCIQLILLRLNSNFVETCIGGNSYLFANGTEIIKFKAKDSYIAATPFCLEIVSKDFSVDNMKKTGLSCYDYDFSVDYDAIAADDILDIHEYLMKKKKWYQNIWVC